MKHAPIPDYEDERLLALQTMKILDTEPEERFDIITRELAEKLNAPISMVTIIDSDREWFKSCHGADVKDGKRDVSFCGHAMLERNVFVVEDTWNDDRFVDNPWVVNGGVRAYAGSALYNRKTGLPIGVLCVKYKKPKSFTEDEILALLEYSKIAEEELNG